MSEQELLKYDPQRMNERTFLYQVQISQLWEELEGLTRLTVGGKVIDQKQENQTDIVTPYPKHLDTNPPVPLLDEGRLIAVRTKSTFEHKPVYHYDLFHLKVNGYYNTSAPMRPIILNHNPESRIMPMAVGLVKWPWGFKIHEGPTNTWWFYHQGTAEFYDLDNETATRAFLLMLEVDKPKQFEELMNRFKLLKSGRVRQIEELARIIKTKK